MTCTNDICTSIHDAVINGTGTTGGYDCQTVADKLFGLEPVESPHLVIPPATTADIGKYLKVSAVNTVIWDVLTAVATWGNITGNILLQTDLQSQFATKEATGTAASTMSAHNIAYTHSDIALNTAARHTHSNKTTLDLITEAFTTGLKSTYDGYASTISGKEPALGNPSVTGYVLSSTALGVRSWIAMSAGVTAHSALSQLDYASSGHTGFQPAGSYEAVLTFSYPLNRATNTISLNYDTNTLDVASNNLKVKDNIFQALSTNLTSLAGLTFASTSFVKMTATGTFGLDTSIYLTAITGAGLDAVFTGGSGLLKKTSAATYTLDTTAYESSSNKVTSIATSSTDVQYTSAKLLYDQLFTSYAPKATPYETKYNQETVIDNMQSSATWSKGSQGVKADDTVNFIRGGQCVSLTSNSAVEAHIDRTGLSIDLTGKMVVLYVNISSVTALIAASGYARVIFSTDSGFTNYYEAALTNAKLNASAQSTANGTWMRLCYSFGELTATGTPTRSNITAIRIQMDDNGNSTVLRVNGICTISEPPYGVCAITFDDNWDSQYTEARKKMDAYGFKGVAYAIPAAIGTAGYCTLAQLLSLQDISGWDIAAHYQTDLTSLTAEQVDTALRSVKQYHSSVGFKALDHFAYPNGMWNEVTVLPIIKKYFKSARTVASFIESFPASDRYKLRVLSIVNTTTTAAIAAAVTRAITNKEFLILVFHKIVATATQLTEYSITDFGTVIDNIYTQGIKVKTMTEAWNMMTATDIGLPNVTNNAQVIAPSANTANYIPQWDGTDSKTLKNGIPISTFQTAETYTKTITAYAGGGQANAVELASNVNIVSTVATSLDSVKLYASATAGFRQVVKNKTALCLAVYPPANGYINGLAQNAYFIVLPNNSITFDFSDATHADTLETGWQETEEITVTADFSRSDLVVGKFAVSPTGKWYMAASLVGTVGSSATPTVAITGVVFATIPNDSNGQAVNCNQNSSTTVYKILASAREATGNIVTRFSAAVTYLEINFGWIKLDAKPTSYI